MFTLAFLHVSLIHLIVAACLKSDTSLCGRLVSRILSGRIRVHILLVVSTSVYPSCSGAQTLELDVSHSFALVKIPASRDKVIWNLSVVATVSVIDC